MEHSGDIKQSMIESLNHSKEDKLVDLLTSKGELLDELIGIAESGSELRSGWFYRFIIRFLTSLEMNEDDARQHYYKILEHKYALSEKMNRDIGLRVATLDYFLNISRVLKNPKIVEITLFEQILRMSKEDPKTGCFNSNFLAEYTAKELKRAERYEQCLSIIMVDIDNFKEVNDRFGHLFGDQVLKKFSEMLSGNVRVEDMIARFGGDEFAVLLPQTGRVGARCLAERIKYRLKEYFADKKYLSEKAGISFSAGIATYTYDAKDYEGLVKAADEALYRSKYMGKDRVYDYLEKEFLKGESANFEDKRKFTRFRLNSANDVEICGKDGLFSIKGRIINISAGGLLLECQCRLSDSIMRKDLGLVVKKIGDNPVSGLNMKGNIVRVTKESERLKFHLALSFENLLDQSVWTLMENYGELVLS